MSKNVEQVFIEKLKYITDKSRKKYFDRDFSDKTGDIYVHEPVLA